jgi:hypothetical protein
VNTGRILDLRTCDKITNKKLVINCIAASGVR